MAAAPRIFELLHYLINRLIDNELLNTIDGAGGAIYFKLSMPTIEATILPKTTLSTEVLFTDLFSQNQP
jgi:hypothetical protein